VDYVTVLLNVTWNTARSELDTAVAYGRQQEDYQAVRFINIDKISRKRPCLRIAREIIIDLSRLRKARPNVH
jgi:hypothetical protein